MFSFLFNYALIVEVALDTCKSIELANVFKAARVLLLAGIRLLTFVRNTLGGKTIQLPARVVSMFTICICGPNAIIAGELDNPFVGTC